MGLNTSTAIRKQIPASISSRHRKVALHEMIQILSRRGRSDFPLQLAIIPNLASVVHVCCKLDMGEIVSKESRRNLLQKLRWQHGCRCVGATRRGTERFCVLLSHCSYNDVAPLHVNPQLFSGIPEPCLLKLCWGDGRRFPFRRTLLRVLRTSPTSTTDKCR